MNYIRAFGGTLVCTLLFVLLHPKVSTAQVDSTKTDSARTVVSPDSSLQAAPTKSFRPVAAWDPRDKYIRIIAPTLFKGELKGRVSAIAGDTIIIEHLVPGKSSYARRESKYERIPFSEVTQCRERIGSRNNIILGTLIGAAAGFSVMSVAVLTDDEHKDFANLSRAIVGLGTAGGAVLGAVIGAFTRTEKWQEVPLGNVRLGLTPHAGATPGFRLSLKF